MSNWRQMGMGVLTALFYIALIFGGFLAALAEGGRRLALPPTAEVVARQPTGQAGTAALATGMLPVQPAAATFTPTQSCQQAPEGWVKLTVLPGDTLDLLAAAYGVTAEMLSQANCIPPSGLMDGVDIFVPPPSPTPTITLTSLAPTARPTRTETVCGGPPAGWVRYTVRSGDTLSAIGRLTGATVNQLMAANCLPSTRIITGQKLWVPYLPVPTPLSPTPTLPLPPTSTPETVIPPSATFTPIPQPSDTPQPEPSDTPPPAPTEPPEASPTPGVDPT
jgi:LysM repeat protein